MQGINMENREELAWKSHLKFTLAENITNF